MTNQKTGVIVQARMGSTRLPGKVLMELSKEETILSLLIKRLKLSKELNEIIIATTEDKKNEAIIKVAQSNNISYFIGDEENVLERYYKSAVKFKLDIIIRVTSDCPFLDPFILDDMIKFFKNDNYDYIRNVDETTSFPRGFEIEIFSFKTLEKAYKLAITRPEKEHVTFYIYNHPKTFSIYSYKLKNLKKINDLRLTVDEIDDLEMCRAIYERLLINDKSINFTIYDIIEIVEKEPDLMNINKHVQQKKF